MFTKNKVAQIFLSIENHNGEPVDFQNENTDVIVRFQNGAEYVASFFSFQNLESIRQKNSKTGDYLYGKFFWAKNMIIIEECSRKCIEQVVNYLLAEGEFLTVFRKV